VAKILVIHHDSSVRVILESLAKRSHQVTCAKNVKVGIKVIPKTCPDVILVGYDAKKEEAAQLLRHFKANAVRTPVVVVLSRGNKALQQVLAKLGAKGFLEAPIGQTQLDQVIDATLKADDEARSGPPPITDEELNSNLSMLEKELNRRMKCFAGKNQVFIRSLVLGGSTTKPRIALRCPLRAEYGLNRDVFYEFIRDVCCSNPRQCEAAVQFLAARETA